ncbi:molybdenum cofactor biosynthesis protein MoaE [Salinisphaera sp. Q1T1-3]|uniref:molybdenum cofactor biosynthesis protein n=1 Tax=Salinisphaera sp. Q1T1-3 TaxID=2321229 RepID=UPI001314BD49|nr:molybdenum cofactor biosynthesis protein MoaE [Salinisphaera sp. Q1T1-3]
MAETVHITLDCHGALVDQLGGEQVGFDLSPPQTPAGLLAAAASHWPAAAGLLARTACARGDTLLAADTELADGDEIALIPPVSGGQDTTAHLTEAPLDLDALMAETADITAGAMVVFGGTVRLSNAGREVTAMDYSAYGPLAARTMAEIEGETLDAFDITACRMQHRTGRLGLGEMSVYIVVRAVHRAPAFAAAEHALEELKARVAVWKNEYYVDGTQAWLDGTAVPQPERPRSS